MDDVAKRELGICLVAAGPAGLAALSLGHLFVHPLEGLYLLGLVAVAGLGGIVCLIGVALCLRSVDADRLERATALIVALLLWTFFFLLAPKATYVAPFLMLPYWALRVRSLPESVAFPVARAGSLILTGLLFLPAPAVFLTTHGADLHDRFYPPPSPHAESIPVPELARVDDTAFIRLLKLGEPLEPIFNTLQKKTSQPDCRGLDGRTPPDWPCIEHVLREAAGPLSAFDAWLAGPSLYKLDRPDDLGQRIRNKWLWLPNYLSARKPDYSKFGYLGRGLAYRALLRQRQGDRQGAQQDLRTIFSLGAFLQQNPTKGGQRAGMNLQRLEARVLMHQDIPSLLPHEIDAMLPSPQTVWDGYRFALGVEWWAAQDALRRAEGDRYWWDIRINMDWNLSSATPLTIMFDTLLAGQMPIDMPLSLEQVLGWYSPDHTHRLLADYLRLVAAGLDRSLASYRPAPDLDALCHSSLQWVRNPVGRAVACQLVQRLGGVGDDRSLEFGLARELLDHVEATKVVLAARRYYQKEKKWPAQETDLVPAYLPAWPVSALDGQPLRWMADKRGLQMLKVDGKTLCRETEPFCLFLFEPPTRSFEKGKIP